MSVFNTVILNDVRNYIQHGTFYAKTDIQIVYALKLKAEKFCFVKPQN